MKGIYRQVRRLKPRQGRVERNSRDDAEEGFALSLSLSPPRGTGTSQSAATAGTGRRVGGRGPRFIGSAAFIK